MHLNLDRVIILAFGFFLLMNAISVTQCIITQVLDDGGYGNLGFYALGAMFGTFGVLSMVSAP
jgi:hypothetical protein